MVLPFRLGRAGSRRNELKTFKILFSNPVHKGRLIPLSTYAHIMSTLATRCRMNLFFKLNGHIYANEFFWDRSYFLFVDITDIGNRIN